MSSKPSSIKNLGPASDIAYQSAGLDTADKIRKLGPDEAYYRLLLAGEKPHFIGYYALAMGLQGRLWSDCRGEEKERLKDRFNAIKQRISKTPKSLSNIETVLDEIGLLPINCNDLPTK